MQNKNFYGDWKVVQKLLKEGPRLLRTNLDRATRRNASGLRDRMKKNIVRSGPGWAPNSPLTVGYKGSSKPLVDHGDLMQAIQYVVVNPSLFFVGIPTTAGKHLVMIMTTHEYGVTIRPRVARALAVPVSRAASELARRHNGIRNIPGLFNPKGSKVLAMDRGNHFEIMFILMREVVIEPRPVIEPALEDEATIMFKRWGGSLDATLAGKRYVA